MVAAVGGRESLAKSPIPPPFLVTIMRAFWKGKEGWEAQFPKTGEERVEGVNFFLLLANLMVL